MEFTIPASMGAQANLLANLPVRKPPDSTKVEIVPDAGKARADMHNTEHHNTAFPAQNKTAPPTTSVEVEPDTLAGPPPSFQVNVLELDQMLQQKLARLETERARGYHSDRFSVAFGSGSAAKLSQNDISSVSTTD
ncbi:hypothetical protein [Aliiroseovarius sp. F47248L]|uniref:hypothetical protein n=1 Tax=Aliiroseovarius sp. F47248L TaxID=2926420 RepID=UPI001FF624EA|nr:hypothetical protein [Aliiroseovarius sp. F47248L]MCK0139324.1 hypothetical protein [Aliiroseovarius sp. F47248L]